MTVERQETSGRKIWVVSYSQILRPRARSPPKKRPDPKARPCGISYSEIGGLNGGTEDLSCSLILKELDPGKPPQVGGELSGSGLAWKSH